MKAGLTGCAAGETIRGQPQTTGCGVGWAGLWSRREVSSGTATSLGLAGRALRALGGLEPELVVGRVERVVERQLVQPDLA